MSAMGLDFSVPFSFTTFPALVFFQQIAHRSLRSLKFFFLFCPTQSAWGKPKTL